MEALDAVGLAYAAWADAVGDEELATKHFVLPREAARNQLQYLGVDAVHLRSALDLYTDLFTLESRAELDAIACDKAEREARRANRRVAAIKRRLQRLTEAISD